MVAAFVSSDYQNRTADACFSQFYRLKDQDQGALRASIPGLLMAAFFLCPPRPLLWVHVEREFWGPFFFS